jgi:hypothetical protein
MERLYRTCPVALFYFFTIQLYCTVKALFTLDEDESWQARAFMSFQEFSQLSFPGQTGTRVAWELTGYYRARSKLVVDEWDFHLCTSYFFVFDQDLQNWTQRQSVSNSFHYRHFPLHKHSTNLGDRERTVDILMPILYKGQEINGYFASRGKPSHIKNIVLTWIFHVYQQIFDRL